MSKLELATRQSQFEGLHEAIDKVRSTSTSVKVDRAALAALLLDHGKLIGEVGESNVVYPKDGA